MVNLSKQEWKEVKEHIVKYNEEFGEVKKQMAVHTNDISWIKEKLALVDTRLWALLTLTILGFLTTIAVRIFFK